MNKQHIILLFLLLCVFTCVSCANADETHNESQLAYEYGFEEIDSDIESLPYGNLVCSNDYDIYTVTLDENSQNPEYAIVKNSIVTQTGKRVLGISAMEHSVLAMAVTENDEIVLVFDDEINSESISYRLIIAVYDQEGTQKNEIDITKQINEDVSKIAIQDIICDKSGNVYILTRNSENNYSMYRFDINGNKSGEIDIAAGIVDIAINNNGEVVVRTDKNGQLSVVSLDFDSNGIKDEYQGIDDIVSYAKMLSGEGETTLYLRSKDGLYSYNEQDKECVEIVKWEESNLYEDDLKYIIPLEDGRFYCICSEGDDISCSTGIIKKYKGLAANRKRITLATSGDLDDETRKAIIDYNRNNKHYKVVFKNYHGVSGANNLVNDMLSGKSPDIIETSYFDIETMIERGLLEDLKPFMESDNSFCEDYFVDGIYEKFVSDDKAFYIPKLFYIASFCVKETEFDSVKNGLTPEDIFAYCENKSDKISLLGNDTKRSMYSLFSTSYDEYVDWENGKCYFDSEEYKEILEFCNSFPDGDDEYDVVKNFINIKEGRQAAIESHLILSTADIQEYYKVFDGNIKFTGFPVSNGKGNIIRFTSSFGISSVSQNKEEAWNVIKEIFRGVGSTYDGDDFIRYIRGFDCSKEEFEKKIIRDMATEKYTEEDGTIINPREVHRNNSVIGPATEEEINILRDMIKNSRVDKYYVNEINKLINDDINSYFAGDKSLEDVVRIVQDKCSKYVSENTNH